MAHIRHSRPNSDPGFEATALEPFDIALSSLGSGTFVHHELGGGVDGFRVHGLQPR